MEATGSRFYAPHLGEALAAQGRTKRWVATQVGISESLIGHAIARRKTLAEPVARQIATLIGVPFTMLFELPNGSDSSPLREVA